MLISAVQFTILLMLCSYQWCYAFLFTKRLGRSSSAAVVCSISTTPSVPNKALLTRNSSTTYRKRSTSKDRTSSKSFISNNVPSDLQKATEMYLKAVNNFCNISPKNNNNAESILDFLLVKLPKQQPEDPVPTIIPLNISILNALMNSLWANNKSKFNGSHAHDMLQILEQQQTNNVNNNKQLQPNMSTYSIVLQAMAKCSTTACDEKMALDAEAVLQKMHQKSHNTNINTNSIRHNKPNTIDYNHVMECWVHAGNPKKATHFLNEIIQLYQSDPIRYASLQPNLSIYSTAIHGWTKKGTSSPSSDAAMEAQALLSQMEGQLLVQNSVTTNSHNPLLRPTNDPGVVIVYGSVMNCWAKSGHPDAAEMAEGILNNMIQNSNMNSAAIFVQPNTQIYNIVINAWANSKKKHASDKAMEILSKMEQHPNNDKSSSTQKPDTITYNTVIKALVNSNGGVKAAIQSEQLLHTMLMQQNDDASNTNKNVKPDVVTYTSVIDCWAKSGAPNAAENVNKLLKNMIQMYQSDPIQHASLKPNTKLFSTVINCWAKCRTTPNSARKAQDMLAEMKLLQIFPNTITYNTVIHAWAKSSSSGDDACQAVEEILRQMWFQSGTNLYAKPNVSTYIAVIDCAARRSHAEKAESYLTEMMELYQSDPIRNADLRPNSQVYNTVMNAYAKSGSAQKAQSILTRMEKEEHMAPNTVSYNTVLHSFAKSTGGLDAAIEAETILQKMHLLSASEMPDVASYVAVIDCWAKSGTRNSGEKASSLLNDMIQLYQSDKIKYANLRPMTQVFNAVINAWAKSGAGVQAPMEAQALLSQMEDMRSRYGILDIMPDTITYNTIITAWAKSRGGVDAALQAEKILHKMHQIYNAGNIHVKPNVKTYGSVIDCWANAAGTGLNDVAAEKAEQMLDDMIKLYQSDRIKYSDMAPNTQVINIVINAFAISGGTATAKAQKILTQMEKMYSEGVSETKPDLITYNTVIKALAKSGGGVEAAKEAEMLLQKMYQLYNAGDSSIKPNFATYTCVVLTWLNSGSDIAADMGDRILADMMKMYQSDPILHENLRPGDMRIFALVQSSRRQNFNNESFNGNKAVY